MQHRCLIQPTKLAQVVSSIVFLTNFFLLVVICLALPDELKADTEQDNDCSYVSSVVLCPISLLLELLEHI